MATTSPLARVKDEFGGKDKLVDKIVGLLGSDEPKDDLRRRLLGAANSKLIRLHGVASQVKSVGGREQLAAAAAQELGRGKDKDYVTKLGTFSSGKLVDILQSAKRRNGRAAAKGKAAKPAAKKSAAPAKAKAPKAAKPAAKKSAAK
ncbi:MAG TPA: hypothetical protein VHU40_07380 [Polyangia bacterium]|jgi:hypothetical protein|nr:hypothetical protein [Polyangia bacterium]